MSLRGWLTRERNKRGAIVVGVALVFAILDATDVFRTLPWWLWFLLVCVGDFIGFAYAVLRRDGSPDET
jgi:hypothetical protein